MGERTGNVDIVTMAMNLFTHGVDPKLDFSDMPKTVKFYEELTGMSVGYRQPYSGHLVFAAFSGSHQDAISKGMKFRQERQEPFWTVPYLPWTPTTSTGNTRPMSSASTASRAKGASPISWSTTSATTCPRRWPPRWATSSRASPTTPTRSSPPRDSGGLPA